METAGQGRRNAAAGQTAPRPARQLVTVGETYDFEIQPARSQVLWLEVRRSVGELLQAPTAALSLETRA
jgi:hypothetical protein